MKFTIETLNDNGSGMKFSSREEFIAEINRMIDEAEANGFKYFDAQIDCDVSVFYQENEYGC